MTSTPETNPPSVSDRDNDGQLVDQGKEQANNNKPEDKEIRNIWKVVRLGVLGLYRSQIPRMAAALAYRTIFSIIPVMAIGLLIFGSIVSDEQVESGVRRVLTFAGISQISQVEEDKAQSGLEVKKEELKDDLTEAINEVIDQAAEESESASETGSGDVIQLDESVSNELVTDELAAGESATGSTSTTDPAERTPESADPFAGADLEEVITDLINRVNSSIKNVPTGWIALTSGLVLLYAAMSMLIEIEKAFNQLCGAPSGRGWLRRLMLYWTILTAGSLLLAATFLAGDAFTRWVVSIAGQESIVGAVMAGYGVSVLISTLLLLGAYLTIPNTKVHFRTALAGAFFAAVLWELGKLGFTTYLRYTTGYAKFYGSIAILPLFMLWVYLTWLIVLLGMQVSYALQNFARLVESKLKLLEGTEPQGQLIIDPLIMLTIVNYVMSGFVEGNPRSADVIAGHTKLDSSQVTQLLDALTNAGITQPVYRGEQLLGWSPARPAEGITVDEVLRAAHSIDSFRSLGLDTNIPQKIKDAVVGSCSGMTLADLTGSGGQHTVKKS
jgi:membrane protein